MTDNCCLDHCYFFFFFFFFSFLIFCYLLYFYFRSAKMKGDMVVVENESTGQGG